LLPRLRISAHDPRLATPALLFAPPASSVELEIGFGGGESLAATAARSPQTGFIGAEPFLNGIAKLLSEIQSRQLTNVRIFDGDARDLLPAIGAGTLAAIHLIYPDPWPKKRHRRRRFLQQGTIAEIHRLLVDGGRFNFASDDGDYAVTTLAAMLDHGGFAWTAERPQNWRTPGPGAVATRYEAKALAEGARPIYLEFVKNKKSCAGGASSVYDGEVHSQHSS
jgi:tRNA (guanine-N7-)-methyltransferase